MSENLDLVRTGLAAFLQGDVERALSFAHPEASHEQALAAAAP